MILRAVFLITSVFFGVSIAATSTAAEWHVDASVASSGDGTSWQEAFKWIEQGINASSHGDTVTVKPGTYRENIDFGGKNIVLMGTDPLDPDVVAGTVIDGGQLGSVVTFSGSESESCILAGFTICNGKGYYGGGIFGGNWQNPTRATIAFNVIAGNTADNTGGGMYACDGPIRYNIIMLNSAVFNGGGLYYCGGTIQGNNISLNSAKNGGGLALCTGTIQDNVVSGNTAGESGGGLNGCGSWDTRIQNNSIVENVAQTLGGGLNGCLGIFQGNRIIHNSATYGGGLQQCHGTIQNNLILGNSASEDGGGLRYCGAKVRNNTIVENTAQTVGGGLMGGEEIINCIFWGNSAPNGAQLSSTAPVTYSCIENWTQGGASNTDSDPQFVDADGADDNPLTYEDNDYHLKSNSPCIDAGKNESWMSRVVDLDGNARIIRGGTSATVDMGAFEYDSYVFKITEVKITSAGQAQVTWSSRAGDSYVIWSCSEPSASTWTKETEVLSLGQTASWTDPEPLADKKFHMVELRQ